LRHDADKLLRGKPLKDALMAQIPPALARLDRMPRLAVVLVGDNEASHVYVGQKRKTALELGLHCDLHLMPGDTSQADLEAKVAELAGDDAIDAVLIQLPLPAGLEKQRALDLIPPEKDIDGLTIASREALLTGRRCHLPATPLGVMRLLEQARVNLKDSVAVVLGRSQLVGTPLADLLLQAGAQVAGRLGRDAVEPDKLCRTADVLCVAVGVPGLVTKDWVKPGAVVIDIGITRASQDGATCLLGDVAPDVAEHARLVTPVPGGVGPMTVASLFTNVVDAAYWRAGLPPVDWVVDPLLMT
jgi:methylenetetrahydrofolate dehydrogenase (NADP+) / methenyltetrahydrofolate cyclohydrolase